MDARAVIFTGVGRVSVETVEIPDPGPGEILVRNAFSTVSPGTEMRTLENTQAGQSPFPFIPGYAGAGQVIAVGDGVEMPVGTLVRCAGTNRVNGQLGRTWGAHCSHILTTPQQVREVPEGVNLRDVPLVKLGAIAYRGVQLARALPHQDVVIIGLGPIGQMSTRMFAMTGARVIAVDVAANRTALAAKAGVETLTPRPENLVRDVQAYLGAGAHAVVDCTGSPAVLKQAPRLMRRLDWVDEPGPSPKYIVQGSYPDEITFSYHHFFPVEAGVHFPRDARPRDYQSVLQFLKRKKVDFDGIVTETVDPDRAPEIYERFLARDPELMTVLFRWNA
jgi:2-desacetyl-2-hydroxyethyl bacteriochlorophyllide A dehydrogenase